MTQTTLEVLKTRLDAHEKEHLTIWTEMKDLRKELKGKVSYTVISILLVILMTAIGYLIKLSQDILLRQDATNSRVEAVSIDVSKIQGKLEPYNVEFKN